MADTDKPLWVDHRTGFPLLPADQLTQLSWATDGPDLSMWHEIGIALRFSRFHDGQGDLTAMVRIYLRGFVGYQDSDLYDAKVILTGSRSKTDAVRACERQVPDWPYWTQTVDRACRIARTFVEEGTPPVDISIGEEAPEPPWLIEPLFRESENALLFGDGGTGKSTLGLWFLLQMPSSERALYLDYEDTEATMRRRLRALARGMGMETIDRPVMYKQADGALPQMADALSRQLASANLRGMVIDSAAMACGGEPEAAESVNGYFRAIRGLHLNWTLTIAHQPKAKERNPLPFGSIFWWNNARRIWQARKAQEPGEDELHIGLWHRKANNGRLEKPRGYHVSWDTGTTRLRPEPPRGVQEFRPGLSQRDQVLAALEDAQGRPLSYDALAEVTEISPRNLYVIVSRMGDRVAKNGSGLVLAEYI